MATQSKKDTKALNSELESALFSDVERWEMFFTQHWKAVVTIALAGVVAVTALFAVRNHVSRKARMTAEKFSVATSPAELESVIAEHPQAPGAHTARYRLAAKYIEAKNFARAQQLLSEVIAGGDAALRGKARLAEAYVLELSGKAAEAAQKFAELSTAAEHSVAIRAEAAYSAGRLFIDLGKPAEAKQVLSEASRLDIAPHAQSAGYWRDNAVELEKSLK